MMDLLDFHSNYKNIICGQSKHSTFLPYSGVNLKPNDLEDAKPWQSKFTVSTIYYDLFHTYLMTTYNSPHLGFK
jgi:hypothetical protein